MKKYIFLSLCLCCLLLVGNVKANEIPSIKLSNYDILVSDSWYGSLWQNRRIINVDDDYIYIASNWNSFVYGQYNRNDFKYVKSIPIDISSDANYMNNVYNNDFFYSFYAIDSKLYLSKFDYETGKSLYTKQVTDYVLVNINCSFKFNNYLYVIVEDSNNKTIVLKFDYDGNLINTVKMDEYIYLYNVYNNSVYFYTSDSHYYDMDVNDKFTSHSGRLDATYSEQYNFNSDDWRKFDSNGATYSSNAYWIRNHYYGDEKGYYNLSSDGENIIVDLYKNNDNKLLNSYKIKMSTDQAYSTYSNSYYTVSNQTYSIACSDNFCYVFDFNGSKTHANIFDRNLNSLIELSKKNPVETWQNFYLISYYSYDDMLYTLEGPTGYAGIEGDVSFGNIYGVERQEEEINVKLSDVNLKTAKDSFSDLKEAIDLIWESEDTNILKVENGKIVPLKVGSTKVYTNYNDVYYYLKVNVSEDDIVTTTKKVSKKTDENPQTGLKDYLFGLSITVIIGTAVVYFIKDKKLFKKIS